MGMVDLLFSFHGRINRRQYWTGVFVSGFGGGMAMAMLGLMATFSSVGGKGAALPALAMFLLLLVPVWFVLCWCGFALQVKRFHDRGRTGYLTLVPFLPMLGLIFALVGAIATRASTAEIGHAVEPYIAALWIINLLFVIDLGCLGSVEGPNRYGDPPGAAPGSPPPAPQPRAPAPSTAAVAATALFGAERAMERAIAARESGLLVPSAKLVAKPAHASALAPRPAPARSNPAAPASFGCRRPAHQGP
jgi:uncharacterized membrane protein YhaH (DUF805 family)